MADAEGRWLRLALAPGQQALIEATEEGVTVHIPDRREEPPGDGVGAPRAAPDTANALKSG